MLKTFTLPNGLKVATYSIPQMKSALLSISVKGGSICDQPTSSGAAHFMEHILCEGIPSYPNIELFSNFIESLAGSFNAYTYTDYISFIVNAPAVYLEELIKICSEVFFEPLFPEPAIEKERGAIIEEIRRKHSTTEYRLNKFFREVRYKVGHPFLLDNEDVGTLQKKDILNYWSKYFFPKNTYLVMIGGFKNDRAQKLVESIFKGYSSDQSFSGYPNLTNDQLTPWVVKIRDDQELKTCSVDLSFPSISGEKPWQEHLPQSLIRTIMGQLNRSRLYNLLRQQMGLVYSITFGSTAYDNFGYAYISTQTALEKLVEVISLIVKEMIGFLSRGPTKEELDFAKHFLTNSVLMRYDHPTGVASRLENYLLWEDRIYSPEEYIAQVNKVTKQEIMDFMKKYWDFSKLNLTIQGPIKSSPANLRKFESLVADLK